MEASSEQPVDATATERTATESLFQQQVEGLQIGFLLSLTGRCVPMVVGHNRLRSLLSEATEMLSNVTGGDLVSIFRHIYRERYRIHTAEKQSAAARYRQAYSSSRRQDSSVELTTEDQTAVLNRVGCSPYSAGLLDYIDWVVDSTAQMQRAVDVCRHALIAWKDVTDKRIKQLNADSTAATDAIQFERYFSHASNSDSSVQPVQVSRKLPWLLSGIALVAYYFHSQQVAASSSATSNMNTCDEEQRSSVSHVPHVYNLNWMSQLLGAYLPLLLGHRRLANAEGLLLAVQLLTPTTNSAAISVTSAGRMNRSVVSSLPIFSQYLTEIKPQDAFSHIFLAANRSLRISDDSHRCWRLGAAVKLGSVAASSADILALTQQMISGMVRSEYAVAAVISLFHRVRSTCSDHGSKCS